MEGSTAHGLIRRVSQKLSISDEEAHKIICSAFAEAHVQNSLIELLGIDEIELIFELVQNAALFSNVGSKNEELAYTEHLLPEVGGVFVDKEDLVSTALAHGDSKFFPYTHFNAVQSRVFAAAYSSSGNLLVSAPTGAGKTDIALLTILRALKEPRAKVVYIAPMKALATEIVSKYNGVLGKGGWHAVEYTGDTEIEAGAANRASVIVCTPEKFDVSTRRLCPLIDSIRLVIIDEIHLLGEDRGPVLEIIVARMLRLSELNQQIIRIVGLSATLPNYADVAQFTHAEHVFSFGQMYRLVPLRITVAGFKKKSKREDEEKYLMGKLQGFKARGEQVLIFVHSRNQTVACAKKIIEFLGPKPKGVCPKIGQKLADKLEDLEITGQSQPETSLNCKAKKRGKRRGTGFTGVFDMLVENGVGVHHAGMSRPDRLQMESLFRDGAISILVSTATLAWGVNLPAHAVIINGTQVSFRFLEGQAVRSMTPGARLF